MMIRVERAILHICEMNAGTMIWSDKELDITDTNIYLYITAQVTKVINSSNKKRAEFMSNSGCKVALADYKKGEIGFIALSCQIAKRIYDGMAGYEKAGGMDVVIAEVEIQGGKYIVILNLDRKTGYVHNVIDNGNTISINTALLPNNQTVKEFAVINEDDFGIEYASKTYPIDGERVDVMSELVLECENVSVSSKQADTSIKKLIRKVSTDALRSNVKLKDTMQNIITAQSGSKDKTYSLDTISANIFESYGEKKEFVDMAIGAGLVTDGDDKLPIDDYTVKKANEKVKVITDNGFEIKFPHGLYADCFETERDSDGAIRIVLKGISSLDVK